VTDQRPGEGRTAGIGFSPHHMDPEVDPSVDFYAYAAGRWLRENPVPADKSRWGAFAQLLDRNFEIVRELLEEAAEHADDSVDSPRRQVGRFYRAAMDTGRRNELGHRPIAAALARIEALASPEAVAAFLPELHGQGVDAGFAPSTGPDLRASSVYAFYLGQGGLSLPDREYYLDPRFEKLLPALERHVEASLKAAGWGADRASEASRAVLAIETELAKASRTTTELRDPERNYHRVERDALLGQHAGLRWGAYLAARGLAALPYAIVEQPEFFDALERLLASRPVADWRAYLAWSVVRDSAPFLDEATERASFEFFRRLVQGQQEPEPAWKRAALVIDGCLGEALGQLYVERAFPPEARARITVLVDDLCAVFRDRLRSREWMSAATRERALAKFARFVPMIGHPAVFRDYSGVGVVADDYLGDVRRAEAFEIRRRLARLGGPVDRTEWGMTPPTVNAYFTPVMNEIVFPAGILQPPFFDPAMDDAVNYGGIGAVIGHEITHGYDDQGRKFDEEGNLHDWWTAADAEEFERRARIVVQEYGGFQPLPGEPVNGELTLGENLADLGGLRIAFEALQRRLAAEPARRRAVDGLSPEQRFFVAWAQVWRQNVSEPELRRRLVADPHSPGRFRAIGAATNMDEFYPAFRVRPGSPMWREPAERVTVW